MTEPLTRFDRDATPYDALSAHDVGRFRERVVFDVAPGPICPNIHEWRAGDVVLFGGERAASDPIVGYQRLLFDPAHARWTHVGILDADMMIWDAMPSEHVRCRPVRDVVAELGQIILRRLAGAPVDAERLSASLRKFSQDEYRIYRVKMGALLLERLRAAKGDGGAFEARARNQRTSREPLAGGAREGLPDPNETALLNERQVICSSFVQKVLSQTIGKIVGPQYPIYLPADFARDPDFDTVPLRWIRPAF